MNPRVVRTRSSYRKAYWKIYVGKDLVGRSWINKTKSRPYISMYLKKEYTGKGIGPKAAKKILKESQYKEVWASIKKTNNPSLRAASKSGGKQTRNGRQVLMKWKKK